MTYTVAIRNNVSEVFKPVSGLPPLSREQAIRAASVARDNGLDAVAFNLNAQ